MNKEQAKEKINALVQKYERLKSEGRIKSYNEEMTKKDFILPLFEALGWDVYNTHADEVSAEEKVSKGRVDYGFRIEGIPKLFLEAKALKADLEDFKWAEQAINYAWHKGVVWAILTDFESVKVFNAEVKTANPAQSQFFALHANQFLDRFEQLWLLSRESLASGAINIEAEKWGKKLKKIPVDKQLLADFTSFRELLSKSVLKNNPQKKLTEEDIDESVQRILDRLIFIRTTEDKEIEPPHLMPLLREDTNKRIVKKLNALFRYYDDTYNSKLFQPHLCEDLEIDDHVLEHIIQGLYRSKEWSIHYNFALLDADILGSIYEQYLGHLLKKTDKRAKLTEGKTHRKEQGIYYTPTYIVDYIVKNTIGEFAKDKKFDMDKIKILDPACGSGSFLIKSFDFLNQYHSKKGTGEQTKIDTSGVSATFSKKLEILKNNIYGVDLDPKAVEIAQLNLLLKAAEKKHRLPTLQENIKCGNSLIDDPNISPRAFKWEEEFNTIMKNGGFDVVIGNPPYVNESLKENEKSYFNFHYKIAEYQVDTYLLFIERGLSMLAEGGRLGFIIPNAWLSNVYVRKFRKYLLENFKIIEILILPKDVFKDAVVDTVILIVENSKPADVKIARFLNQKKIDERKVRQVDFLKNENYVFDIYSKPEIKKLLQKLELDTQKVGEICEVNRGVHAYRVDGFGKSAFQKGVQTKRDYEEKSYHYTSKKNSTYHKEFRGKNIFRYYDKWGGNWVSWGDWLAEPREWKYFTGKRITLRKIVGKTLICTMFKEDAVFDQSVYVAIPKKVLPEYLLGILNSKLMVFYFKNKHNEFDELFPQIKVSYFKDLPIKISSDTQQKKLCELVDKILQLNKKLIEIGDKNTSETAKLKDDIAKVDAEIDELVYKLYGLTEAEKKIVEDSLKSD